MSVNDDNQTEFIDDDLQTVLPEPPRTGRAGVGLVAVALALPVLAGVVLLFVTSFGPALAISAATVLVSSILVALFFTGGPLLRAVLVPPGLPTCASREVVKVLDQVIRGQPVGATVKSIDGHREISFDPQANRRQGQCVVHTTGSDIVVNYIVEWQDRSTGKFLVRTTIQTP